MPEKYWCDFFGLSPKELRKPGFRVVPHKGLDDYNGAWIFKIDQSVIISVPDSIKSSVEKKVIACENSDDVLCTEFAEKIFQNIENIERTIGPCYQGYCTAESSIEFEKQNIRLIAPSEYSLLEKMQQVSDEEAFDHSSISQETTNFGYFENDEIVAAACLDMWSEKVANIGLLTLPGMQGKGCAKKLCSFATKFGLAKGYEMAYQTLQSNSAAVAVARATGYIEYANHLAVRFKSINQ